METNPEFLVQCLRHTLSPAREPRSQAETKLAKAAQVPNYGLAVLRLVDQHAVDEHIRLAAAVNFKNHVRTQWAPSTESALTDAEKNQIKTLIVSLMLSSSPPIQSQLSESLSLIANHDFPRHWPTLLPELVSNLRPLIQSKDYASINTILGTANSIFKKFRYPYKTSDVLLDLKYCLDNFAAPLLEIFLATASLIDSVTNAGAQTLKPLFQSQRLCCRIFFSLSFHKDLPKDHMKEWMGEFIKYLRTDYPVLESSAEGVALVDELRAAVCENISRYMQRTGPGFKEYLHDFSQDVWNFLSRVSLSSGRDRMAIAAIKLLTTVRVHLAFFANDGVFCQGIMTPKVREGSDVDTRRRIACELLKGIAANYKKPLTKHWPTLLPELVSNLHAAVQSKDYASINSILGTANSIFKEFRYQYKNSDLLLDLKYCLDNFATPLLEIFLATASLIDSVTNAGGAAPQTVNSLLQSQRLCCRIFFSLNFQDLLFFEDHMKEWMGEFLKYLTTDYSVLDSFAECLALVDELRAAVCENISLYMEKTGEGFKDYLHDFFQAVRNLLASVSLSSGRKRLAIAAIKFLTTVSTSVHHTIFANDGVIAQICQGIVIPNVRLRVEDETLFKMYHAEFIRRDMEGSDVDSRRRTACELLKGIATNYKKPVADIVYVQIQYLLTSYGMNPAEYWLDKECAIYLIVSLSTGTDLVDVQKYFTSVIVPELQSQNVNAFPMVKAGAVKFFTMFRNQISKPLALQFFGDLVGFLGAESYVVHSYASICLEKLLIVKDEGGRVRYTGADITPLLQVLMSNLFNALKFPVSKENQYIMKCIMRVLGTAEISPDIGGACISGLTSILIEVCKKPKNSIFNHYLFESVAVLVRWACERDTSLIPALESSLFLSLQLILKNDVSEFLPYVFQLLAQLIELNSPPIPQNYMQIFKLILLPESWEKISNVPALVRLLQAFVQKAPQKDSLEQVLGIFQRLVSSASTDEQGFYLLNTIIQYLDIDVISIYMKDIWNILFTRLKNKHTVKCIESFLIFASLFLVKHGSANLVDSVNTSQQGIFEVILDHLWIPNLKLITGSIEVKLAAVASVTLICEYPVLLKTDSDSVRRWSKMLDSIVTLVSRPEEDRVEEEAEMPDIAEDTATFVNLYNAGKKEDDPLLDIKDAKEFLVVSLARLSALSPGRYPLIISENLEPANQAALLKLCTTYNCRIF